MVEMRKVYSEPIYSKSYQNCREQQKDTSVLLLLFFLIFPTSFTTFINVTTFTGSPFHHSPLSGTAGVTE